MQWPPLGQMDGWQGRGCKTGTHTASGRLISHLGHEKNGPVVNETGNVRNGTGPKTVLTESAGEVGIEVRWDREGTSGLQIVKGAAADRAGRDRAVALCQRAVHRGDLGALRGDLRGLG